MYRARGKSDHSHPKGRWEEVGAVIATRGSRHRRRMTRPLVLSLLVLLSLTASSCGGGVTASSCPTGGTALTYASFGQPFMSTHCTSCHGSARSEKGVSLASQAQVQAHAAAVESTVSGGSMPPSGGSPTATERAQLAEWLACGAP
jgi:uncharacterized membrane protein